MKEQWVQNMNAEAADFLDQIKNGSSDNNIQDNA